GSCGTLLPQQSCTCTGTYTPPSSQCGPFSDTATATGTGECSQSTATGSDSATCSVPRSPSLTVNKSCVNASGPGHPIHITLAVTNNGHDDLKNVNIDDIPFTPLTCTLSGGAGGGAGFCPSIPVGAACICQGDYVPPSDQCGPFTDSAHAFGTGVCSHLAAQ